MKDSIIRVCIPLGYVLFVAVPFALTLRYVLTRATVAPQAEVMQRATEAPPLPVVPPVREEDKALAARPVVKFPHKIIEATKGKEVPPAAAKSFTTPAELFADMPKEVYPKASPEYVIERAETRKWCKANIVGRSVEWTIKVKEIQITGDEPFSVFLSPEGMPSVDQIGYEYLGRVFFGEPFSLGTQRCNAVLRDPGGGAARLCNNGELYFADCTAAKAKELRKLKDEMVTVRAKISDVTVEDQWNSSERHGTGGRVTFSLRLSILSVHPVRTKTGAPDMPPSPHTVPEVVLAPQPRELPEVFEAPLPREITWRLPPLKFTSPWQKVGAVDLRVAGLAVAPVPIIDGKKQVTESPAPMLVIVIEARTNTPSKKREMQSLTFGQNHYTAVYLSNGRELPHLELPAGSKLYSGLPLRNPLPPDGTPVHDVIVFTVPPDGSGDLKLRVDSIRCGEAEDVWFKIPAGAWKK